MFLVDTTPKKTTFHDVEDALSETTSFTHSETGSHVEEEDYFTKFSTLAGWQSILLMQFQIQMKVAVFCSIYFTYMYCMVDLAFGLGTSENIYVNFTYTRFSINNAIYTGDIIYAVDCLSMLIFKKVQWEEIRYRYKPRSKVILVIEILSLIPLEACYTTMVKPILKVYTCLRLRYAFRLVRLHSYFTEAKDYVGTNTHLLHLAMYVFVTTLLIVTITSISYISQCRDSPEKCLDLNYNLYVEDLYLTCALWTFIGATSAEKSRILDNVLMSFMGFMVTAFFTGYFVCTILRRIKAKCHFINMCMWRRRTIANWKRNYVKDWTSFHKKYETLMEDYAVILWDRTHGNYTSTYLGEFLPPIMYKEIFLDISWIPLKHSHLFRSEDVFFLRLVSQMLKQRFFCPGEVIYQRDQFKSSMVYIVSGTADILSEEDGETAIMSLSSGTCIGESSLVVSYPSTSTVVSRDICDVAVLDRKDFARIAVLYPEKMKRIIYNIQNRYTKAKSFKALAEYQFKTMQFDERVGVLTMKWLKHTLRSLLFNVRKVGDLLNRHYLKKLEENVFCTTFLDLLAQAEDEDVVVDAIFIKSEFPYVFRPDSVFTKLWNLIIMNTLIYLLISYPWFMVYYADDNMFFKVSFGFVTLCWITDIYLRASTAIKTKYHYYNTVSDILTYNLSSFTFILDIFAAIPWEVIVYLIEGNASSTATLFVTANRLIKVYKLEQIFTTVKVKTRTLVYLTLFKFCIYLIIIFYYITAVCFLLGRMPENFEQFMDYTAKFGSNDTMEQVFSSMFGVVEFYCDLDVVGFPFVNFYKWRLVLVFFQYVLAIFNICFIAYLSATVTMNMIDEHRMEEYNRDIAITMQCFKFHLNTQKRVWRYIQLQYAGAGIYFLVHRQIFAQYPKELVIMSRGIYLSDILKLHPLFYYLEDVIIAQVAYIATVHLVPEEEVIIQIGEVCPEIYILIDGVCRMENFKAQFKIIEQSEAFNVLEACLDIKSLVTVRTETPCLLATISIAKLKATLLRHKTDYDQFMQSIDGYPLWAHLSMFSIPTPKETASKKQASKGYHYFGYFLKKRTKKYVVYQEGFTPKTWVFQQILMRITFSSSGAFVFYWELVRSVLAFATAISIPIVEFHGRSNFSKGLLCLDITAYIDIYLRHHFSYYNRKGIEVMHPMKTAKYYWTHSFCLDLLGCVPLELLFTFLFSYNPIGFNPFRYNRYLQLYRFRHFVNIVFNTKVRLQCLIVLKYMPYVIIAIHTLSSIFLRSLCSFTPEISCEEKSCIYSKINSNTTLFDVYGLGIYVTTMAMTYSNHFLITIGTGVEVVFIVIAAFIGLIAINLFLAKIIEVNLSVNRDLSIYQEAMQRLKQFLAYRKIDKHLKTELINHFEYRWKRTKGKSIYRAFVHFKRSFKVETLYTIYGARLKFSTIFPAPNEGFFRSLLLEVSHEMYLKRAFIYKVNDVSDDIYLLLKGTVDVVGADGSKLTYLTLGSVFGNLDNCPLGRRTLSIVASSHVEVLRFSSTVFYKHLSNFSHLKRHFRRLTVFDVDFLSEESQNILQLDQTGGSSTFLDRVLFASGSIIRKAGIRQMKVFKKNLGIIIWENFVICYVAYFSYFVELYHLTTLDDSYMLYTVMYIIDIIFLIKIYMCFHTSYEDEYGKIVTDRNAIAKRYIKMKLGFCLDVFTTIPFEVFLYAFNDASRRYMYPIFRLNRFPRVIIGIWQLRSLTEKLNVIVIVVRMWYLISLTLLVTFTLGSTLLFFDYKYRPTSSERMYYFLTSVQYIVNSCICASKVMPEDQLMHFHWTLWVSILLLFAKGIYTVFITECCSILIVVNHTRNSYEQFMIFIKSYLHNENVSIPLAEKVIDYTNLLWAYHKGVQFPHLLEDAPNYLREAVLNSMFGFHLDNHVVLKHLHKDLARQMTARMKTLVFFPGDKVTYVGDIDRCMYFIDEGEVVALSEDTMFSEVVENVLQAGEMFGLTQGIQSKVGHAYTYKATRYTVLVALKRDDWIHLLDFYPASKYIISEEIGEKLDRI